MGFKSERDRRRRDEDSSGERSSASRSTAEGSERGDAERESATSRNTLARRGDGLPKRKSGTAGSPTANSDGRVTYDHGPDHEVLSGRYGLEFVKDGQAQRLQRLETEFGNPRVKRWADEGMTVGTMGKPRDMQAFRERQARRPAEVPRDVERRNEASLQRSALAARDSGPAGEAGVPDVVREVVSSPGTSMDETVQREMESKMGGDFSDVRVHTGPKAAAAAESIDARAFTVGNHVAFNREEYRPGSDDGKKLLAHELTHVRQQTDGRLSLLPKAPIEVDPDPALEREAERVARNVAAEDEPAGAGPAATHPGAEMHVQRQPAETEGTTADGSESRDEREDAEEPEDAGPSIDTDEATRVVAEVLRDWGIRAPPGMSLEEEYLHTGDSSDSVFLYMTGDNTPTPPAEWVIENTPGEGIAQGAKKVLTFRILIATDDEYWVQVNQTSLETGAIEYSRGGYADRYDGELIKEQMAGILTQLEGDGVEIGLPSEDVWMPSEDEDSEAEQTDSDGGDTESGESESDQESEGGSGGEPGDDDGTYTIQEGDTLWDIAQEHGVEGGWQRLWKYGDNEEVIGDDPDLIFPGDTIEIPAGSENDVERTQPAEVQPKLEVSSPDDPAEKEAERVAEAVMKMDGSEESGDGAEAERDHARREVGLVRTVPVTRSATGTAVPGEDGSKVRKALQGGGKPLPGEARSFFEPRFGVDFSDVQVHTGSAADEAARSIDAKAFTMGSNVAFANGNYDPGSSAGRELLAHELTHVVQQTSAASRATASRQVAERGEATPTDGGLPQLVNQFLAENDDPSLGYYGVVWEWDDLNRRWTLPPEKDSNLLEAIQKTGRDIWMETNSLMAGWEAHPSTDADQPPSVQFADTVVRALARADPPPVDRRKDEIERKLRNTEILLGGTPRDYEGVKQVHEAYEIYNEVATEWNEYTETIIGTASATVTTLEVVETGSAMFVGASLTVTTGGTAAALGGAAYSSGQTIVGEASATAVGLNEEFPVQEVAVATLREFALSLASDRLGGLIAGKLKRWGGDRLAAEFGDDVARQLTTSSQEVVADLIEETVLSIGETIVEEAVNSVYAEITGEEIDEMEGEAFLDRVADELLSTEAFADILVGTLTPSGPE